MPPTGTRTHATGKKNPQEQGKNYKNYGRNAKFCKENFVRISLNFLYYFLTFRRNCPTNFREIKHKIEQNSANKKRNLLRNFHEIIQIKSKMKMSGR
jgi:hypothetical protein